MSACSDAARQRNRDDQQQEAEAERDDVAEAGEGGRRQRRGQRGIDHSCCAPWQRLDDMAVRIDQRADAGRGRADHRQALLRRAKPGLGEVLRRAPAAEPGVVRRVEDEVGPVAAVHNFAREDDLIAKLEADLAPIAGQLDRPRARAVDEVDIAGREPRQADRGEQRPHRQIFAVGDEVRLVVAAEDTAERGHHIDAVGRAIDQLAVARRQRETARQQHVAGSECSGSAKALGLGHEARHRLGHPQAGP